MAILLGKLFRAFKKKSMKGEQKKAIAEQFQAELDNDVRFQEMLKRKEENRNLKEKILNDDAHALMLELREAGFSINSVWDFVNTTEDYAKAVSILVKHLSYDYMERNKEGIVRALAIKSAKGLANAALIDEYNKTPPERHYYRWAIGNTLNYLVSKDDIDKIIPIVLDKSNGDSRDMFIKALGKFKIQKVKETLEQLVKDDEVSRYVGAILKRW